MLNLRSRIDQNLTQDNDFIEVLDSLKVERGLSNKETSPSASSKPIATAVNLNANLEIMTHSSSSKATTSKESNVAAIADTTLSTKSNNSSVRSLNSQKRKIEQDDDFFQPKRGSLSETNENSEESGFNRLAKDKEDKDKRRNYRNLNSNGGESLDEDDSQVL